MELLIELLTLFFVFFKIGLFTFGGGYAMIPMIREEMINGGYFTSEQITYLIGIGEATPGPFAVNMAGLVGFFAFEKETYIIQLLGSLIATIGVVLPSFIIILLFSIFSYKIIKTKPYKDAFLTIQPMVLGFIFAAFLTITGTVIFGHFFQKITFDLYALIIFGIILTLGLFFKKIPPIVLILISAILGIVLYGFL
ncbi:MAG: chromate transporter [Acholeplasmataceae bacterium]|jgi:chromate transporter|nr:chromate transporter [Acholeplasmataceae bacterium]